MASAAEWAVRLREHPVVVIESDRTQPDRAAKGGRTYSKGLMTVLGIGEDRAFGGLARALSAYRSRSEQSATRRRDGAVLDFARNAVRAQEKFVVQISKIPRDLTRSRTYRSAERALRKPVVNLLRW